MSSAIQEAQAKAGDIETKIEDFFGTVNSLLEHVPGFLEHLIEPIKQGLEKLKKKIQGFWDKINEFLENTGDPEKLKQYATTWRDKIGNPIGHIAETISEEKLETNTEWTGSGAEAYKAVIPSQKDGLDSIKDASTDLSSTLKELADGIEDFWIAMGIAFGSLVVGMASAAVEAATVVAIPGAIATAIGALGVAVGFIGDAIIQVKGIYDTIDNSQTDIGQDLKDMGDKWAKAKPVNQKKIDDDKQWEPN